jgi:hypothetical protein
LNLASANLGCFPSTNAYYFMLLFLTGSDILKRAYRAVLLFADILSCISYLEYAYLSLEYAYLVEFS